MQRAIPNQVGMTNRRPLVIAVTLGAIAAGLTVALLASSPAVNSVEAERSVVVARRAVEAGAVIQEGDLGLRSLPVSAVVADAVADVASVVGQKARYPLTAGAQVGAAGLVGAAKVQALSFQIPVGQRGFTVPVTETQSPASLIAPGDFVDVIVAAEAQKLVVPGGQARGATTFGSGADAKAAVTLLQNVQVLSVQQTYVENGVVYDASVRGTPPEGSVTHVTLSLTPDDAQLLWLASQDGKVTLSLRAFGDNAVSAALSAPTAASR